MAETIDRHKRINRNALVQTISNEDITVGTTTTTGISAYRNEGYETKSATLKNIHPSVTTAWKVWSSDSDSPGTLGGSDWGLIGSEISVAANSTEMVQWRTPGKWFGITATGASSATGNSVYVTMKTL